MNFLIIIFNKLRHDIIKIVINITDKIYISIKYKNLLFLFLNL